MAFWCVWYRRGTLLLGGLEKFSARSILYLDGGVSWLHIKRSGNPDGGTGASLRMFGNADIELSLTQTHHGDEEFLARTSSTPHEYPLYGNNGKKDAPPNTPKVSQQTMRAWEYSALRQ